MDDLPTADDPELWQGTLGALMQHALRHGITVELRAAQADGEDDQMYRTIIKATTQDGRFHTDALEASAVHLSKPGFFAEQLYRKVEHVVTTVEKLMLPSVQPES